MLVRPRSLNDPVPSKRVLKFARTLADLEGIKDIGTRQLAEALAYRRLGTGVETEASRLGLT